MNAAISRVIVALVIGCYMTGLGFAIAEKAWGWLCLCFLVPPVGFGYGAYSLVGLL